MSLEVQDARLQHYLKRMTSGLPYEQREQLKNIRFCNTRAVKQIGFPDNVYLMRDKHRVDAHDVMAYGMQTCKNPFCCPHCSAIRMTHYRKEIGAYIDALDDKGLDGFMVSLSIPHLRFQETREVTDLLFQTWSAFFANCFKNRLTKSGKFRACSPTNTFFHDLDIKYYVRVCEYTFSYINGWHPHFHVLFFVDHNKMSQVLQYEELLQNHWKKCFIKVAKKYCKTNGFVDDRHANYLDYYEHKEPYKKSLQGFLISRTESGDLPYKVTSAAYVCGWTSDREMTGNIRKAASHDNHFTPHQILEKAANGDKQAEQVYIEFMLQVTRKPVHHRVDFRKGTKCIAIQKINQAGYQEVLKKKSQTREWEIVCYFTSEEWQRLSYDDLHEPVISNILYLAHLRRDDLLRDYLAFYNIPFRQDKPRHVQFVEDVCNNKIAA